MACERVDITVLVVDDDDSNLAMIASLLRSWEYKVLTVKNAHDALETLRDFEGIFDLVITELHMPGMDGFELQKRIKEEFQLPVIMMSEDRRKSVVAKSLENGAAFYILKPVCLEDFKDIWQYAMAARKGKLIVDSEMRNERDSSGEKITFQDVNSSAASSVIEPQERNTHKYSKRKDPQRNKGDQCEGSSRAPKKQKVVWTTYLHNLFLLAIKQIGLEKAVPKKILEIMNVPGLTRENVASHLQKYRIFLRKVAEIGELESLSDRALKSRFASGLSTSMIHDIQKRIAQLRVPVRKYLRRSAQQTGKLAGTANALNPSNTVPIPLNDHEVSSSACVPQLASGQLPNPLHRDPLLQNRQAFNSDSLNQLRLGQSSFGISNQANNFQQQPMLGCYLTPLYQANHHNNAGPIFPAYRLGYRMNYGNPMCRNRTYGSLRNYNSSYGPGNSNLGSFGSSNLARSSTYYPSTSSNYSGIQMNVGSRMVGTRINQGGLNSIVTAAATANNNSFCLINWTANANMLVAPAGHGNSGLFQGWSASAARVESARELSSALLIANTTREEDISGIPPLLDQRPDGLENAGDEHRCNVNSMSEGEASQLENCLTELFLMLDDMHLLNETEENPHASEFLNSDFSSSCHVEQSPEQPQGAGDVIVASTESSINHPNEATSYEKPNQLQDTDGFANWDPFDIYLEDNASSASNSAIKPDWDMDLIEALFGTHEPNKKE